MKKLIIIASIILLAAGCSKSKPVVQTPSGQNPPVTSSTPTTPIATSTPPKSPVPPAPITLGVYTNAPEHFKVLYLSYFSLFTGSQVKANNTKGVNFSGCVPYGEMPDLCFVLKGQPYANTNLSSAAVTVSVLKNKTNIGNCFILFKFNKIQFFFKISKHYLIIFFFCIIFLQI